MERQSAAGGLLPPARSGSWLGCQGWPPVTCRVSMLPHKLSNINGSQTAAQHAALRTGSCPKPGEQHLAQLGADTLTSAVNKNWCQPEDASASRKSVT